MADAQPMIKDAVVYTTRNDVLDAVRQEVKGLGIKVDNIKVPQGLNNCLKELEALGDALLVIDWEAGVSDVLKVLATIKKQHKIDNRPTFLIAAKLDEKIVAAGAEYGVLQVQIGDISRQKIKDALTEIIAELTRIEPLRQVLLNVAAARTQGQWDTATKLLEDLNQKDPQNMRIVAELADNYIHADQWDKAGTLLEPLKDVEPLNTRLMHLLGRFWMKKGRHEEAATLLTKAKLINPYNVERLVDLGNVLLRLDRVEEANENFEAALDLAPGSEDAKKGKGKCLLMEGDVNEALVLLREVSSGYELGALFNTTAVISIRHGRFKEGMALYDAAVRAVGQHPLVVARLFYNMGIGYYRWKKTPEAKACFQKAVEMDPNHQNAKFNVQALSKGKAIATGAETENIIGFEKNTPQPAAALQVAEEKLNPGFEFEEEDEL